MNKEQEDVLRNTKTWLSSENSDYVEFIGRLLTSLPGGEDGEGVFEPLIKDGFGWQEVTLIYELLGAIEYKGDVKLALRYLFGI